MNAPPPRLPNAPEACLPPLQADAIRAALGGATAAGLAALELHASLDSTNAELLRRPLPPHGVSVLLAETQTAGRGRLGRRWQSPPRAHLYLSLARRFGGDLRRLSGMGLMVGVAVAEALRGAYRVPVQLKWPNDLVVADAKLGGILVEAHAVERGSLGAVAGLGLNVAMPADMEVNLDQPWIDLARLLPAPPDRSRLAAGLLDALLPALEVFDADGLAPFLSRFEALDALRERPILVHRVRGVADVATALGLAADGGLRVRLADGEERVLHSGEVSVRPLH